MKSGGKVLIWIAVILSNLFLLAVTLFLQIIGYGTAPKIFADSEVELNKLIDNSINTYNKTFFIEMAFIAAILFGLDYLFFKKLHLNRPFIYSILFIIVYIIISLSSLMLLGNTYRSKHF